MAITPVPIRAIITVGDIVVKTPYIVSFNVNKSRNSMSTFTASLKIPAEELNAINDNTVVIEAGEYNKLKKIFTGFILQSTPSPCWDDPNYVVLNVSGSDILYRLSEERFTRRQISVYNKWAIIEGVNTKADKGSQFRLVNHEVITPTGGDFVHDNEKKDTPYVPIDINTISTPTQAGRGVVVEFELGPITFSESGEQ